MTRNQMRITSNEFRWLLVMTDVIARPGTCPDPVSVVITCGYRDAPNQRGKIEFIGRTEITSSYDPNNCHQV